LIIVAKIYSYALFDDKDTINFFFFGNLFGKFNYFAYFCTVNKQ